MKRYLLIGGFSAALLFGSSTVPSSLSKDSSLMPSQQFDCYASTGQARSQKTYIANVSAYCLCSRCCGKWAKVHPRRTASGHIIKKGDKFIAAPKNIPFGTWIDVPGYGRAQVLDRGGVIKDNRLDLYFESHAAALKWGRQYLSVTIQETK